METPWSRARKLRSTQQEARLSLLPGGRTGVNSGRIWRWPRDGRILDFLVEARTNNKRGVKSYRIDKQEWLDLRKQALHEPGGMKPAMQISMDEVDLMVIELRDFSDLIAQIMTLEPDK